MNHQLYGLDPLLDDILIYCLWSNVFVLLVGLVLVLFLLTLEKLNVGKELRHSLLSLLIIATNVTAFISAYLILFVFSISVISWLKTTLGVS